MTQTIEIHERKYMTCVRHLPNMIYPKGIGYFDTPMSLGLEMPSMKPIDLASEPRYEIGYQMHSLWAIGKPEEADMTSLTKEYLQREDISESFTSWMIQTINYDRWDEIVTQMKSLGISYDQFAEYCDMDLKNEKETLLDHQTLLLS